VVRGIIKYALTVGLLGCAAMLPKIESQHPEGYSKVIKLVPECSIISLDNYSSCLVASEMLESISAQLATVKFITHWENVAFGHADRMQKAGESRHDLVDTLVFGDIKYDEIQATKKIVIPVLRQIYKSSEGNYEKTMYPQVDLIELTAKSSFDSFREIHTKALTSSFDVN